MNAKDACPCDSTRLYAHCCGRFHAGEPAASAEALMRSRYSAFVLCNEPYLLATWHSSTRPKSIEFEPQQKWLGLKIVTTETPNGNGVRPHFHFDTAHVEFIARYRVGGGSAARLHERSRFVQEHGRWAYVDGELLTKER